MERISIDTIGPLPSDNRGNCYIIVIIDNFLRFVEFYPVPNAGADYAATTLVTHIGRYGAPAHSYSDGGRQFVNQILAELVILLRTEHVITTYSHQENGLVERANKEVLRYLRAILFDKNIYTDWAIYLPLLQRIINSEVHSSTGVSPAQIIFGNAITLDRGVYQTPPAPRNDDRRPLSAYMANLLLQQKNIIEIAIKHQRHKDELSLRAGIGILPTEFPINSYVLAEYPEGHPPTKFHTPKRGPLKVLSYVGRKYKLLNIVTNKEETMDISRLSPFTYDNSTIDPRLIANGDYQVFDVERILEHSGNPKRKSSLDFLVQWVGMDSSFKRWLPWKELVNNSLLHKYLFDNKLSHLIPKHHRKDHY